MRMVVVLGSYAVITILFCSPFVAVSNLGAMPVMDGDVSLHLWSMSWGNYALRHQPFELFQANAFYPHPNSLTFSEHFFGGALLVLPWYSFSDNPVYPYNLLFLASYFLSALSMYFLAFHYTRNWWASWLAGVIYGFCFFRAHHFTHLSLIFNPWIPLVVLAYEKLVTSFRWRRWAMLLVLAVLQCLTNWYTAFFVVLILGWRVLFDLLSKRLPKERIPALMGLMICAAALILPFYLPYLEHQGAPGALDEVRYNSANLGSYLQPPFNTFLGQWLGTERRWIWGERSTYAGYVALVLAVAGFYVLIRRQWNGDKRYLFLTYFSLGLFAFFVSLGPYFLDLGGFVSPVRLLYWVVPPLLALRAVARLAAVVMFCLAMLAALVTSRFRPQTARFVVPALAILFLFEHYPVGLGWDPGQAEAFRPREVDLWLKQNASKDDVLLELPGYSKEQWNREAKYMLYSTQHWLKLVNGYGRFYPEGYLEDQKIFATYPSDEALELLREYGVDYVVIDGKEIHEVGPT